MSAAQACASAASYSVNLIDKDDGWCGLLCLVKQITHARRTDTDIQFKEVRTGYREERNARFTCNSLCQQCFTVAGRAHKQYALGNLSAYILILFRVLQKIDDFLKLGFFLVRSGDVRKCHLVFGIKLRLDVRLAHGAYLSRRRNASGHGNHDEYHNAYHQKRWDKVEPEGAV